MIALCICCTMGPVSPGLRGSPTIRTLLKEGDAIRLLCNQKANASLVTNSVSKVPGSSTKRHIAAANRCKTFNVEGVTARSAHTGETASRKAKAGRAYQFG